MVVSIQLSKTYQYREGVDLVVARFVSTTWPVESLKLYIDVKDSHIYFQKAVQFHHLE